MAWLSGHSLAQTVYTCIYFHHVRYLHNQSPPSSPEADNLDLLMQVVFRAYILGSVKCCHHIWNEMVSGNIYEVSENRGCDLCVEWYWMAVVSLDIGRGLYDKSLWAVTIRWYQRRWCIERSTGSFTYARSVHGLQQTTRFVQCYHRNVRKADSHCVLSSVIEAIYQRLLSRQLFLQSLLYLAQPQCTHVNEAQKTLTQLHQHLDPASIILATLDLGQEVKGAFDPNINRKLTSQAPPRTVSLQTHQQSYEEFLQITKRLESICTISRFLSVSATKLPSAAPLMVSGQNNSNPHHY